MSTQPRFTVVAHQNEYLPAEGRRVDAVITVEGSGAEGGAVRNNQDAAELILIDISGSMSGAKLQAAKQAAVAAIELLPDDVAFGIIAGESSATLIYPDHRGLARSSAGTRQAGKAAVRRLSSRGGTEIGSWLRLANDLFRSHGAQINHAILLTDGANNENEATFNKALRKCTGRFVCDSRGVGNGWVARDLINIAETLLGTASGIPDPAGLEADFRAMIQAAMGKTMAEVMLRVWTPTGAKIQFVKQVHPEIVDLTGRRKETNERIGEYPTGAWGAESREYHLSVDVEPGPVGEELLAARVSIVHGPDVLAQCLVRAVWTDDLAASTKINRQVAHYTNESELAEAIQTGLAARAAGDMERATDRLGHAWGLAKDSGREDTAKLLAKVVDVDEETNTVRVRSSAASIDIEMAAVGSRKTQQVRPEQKS